MEKFIKFKENVNIKELEKLLSDERILLLRESKLTGTIQIKILSDISSKQIKKAFNPYKIKRIYNEFPYSNKKKRLALFNSNN